MNKSIRVNNEMEALKTYVISLCDRINSDLEEINQRKYLNQTVHLGLWETSYLFANSLNSRYPSGYYYICRNEIKSLLRG